MRQQDGHVEDDEAHEEHVVRELIVVEGDHLAEGVRTTHAGAIVEVVGDLVIAVPGRIQIGAENEHHYQSPSGS
ncbi:hypothetical protein [Streptomyces zaomyceticus]|uniref:hypothetical protein n=1 Tax=Streptomyces zaomyceticus TaxID=68286 RepID=UPI00367C7231